MTNKLKQFLSLKTKKEITKFAAQNDYKLHKKSTNKEIMKKELFELMFPEHTIDYKTVEIVLEEHAILNGDIVYKGNDGFLYDCDGNILSYK